MRIVTDVDTLREDGSRVAPSHDRAVVLTTDLDGDAGQQDLSWNSRRAEGAPPAWDAASSVAGLRGPGGPFDPVTVGLRVGAVPGGMSGARVLWWSPGGTVPADGTRSSWLEIPTFPNPIDESRPFYAVSFTGSALDRFQDSTSTLFFVDADRTVVAQGCDDLTLEQCDSQVRPGIADIVAELTSTGSP